MPRHRDECLAAVGRMVSMRNERYVSGFYIASGLIAAGDLNQAKPWIERAAAERSPWFNFLRFNPGMRALHGRPAIQAIMARLGQGA